MLVAIELVERGALDEVAAAAADEEEAGAEEAAPPPDTLAAQFVVLPAWMGICEE